MQKPYGVLRHPRVSHTLGFRAILACYLCKYCEAHLNPLIVRAMPRLQTRVHELSAGFLAIHLQKLCGLHQERVPLQDSQAAVRRNALLVAIIEIPEGMRICEPADNHGIHPSLIACQ